MSANNPKRYISLVEFTRFWTPLIDVFPRTRSVCDVPVSQVVEQLIGYAEEYDILAGVRFSSKADRKPAEFGLRTIGPV